MKSKKRRASADEVIDLTYEATQKQKKENISFIKKRKKFEELTFEKESKEFKVTKKDIIVEQEDVELSKVTFPSFFGGSLFISFFHNKDPKIGH